MRINRKKLVKAFQKASWTYEFCGVELTTSKDDLRITEGMIKLTLEFNEEEVLGEFKLQTEVTDLIEYTVKYLADVVGWMLIDSAHPGKSFKILHLQRYLDENKSEINLIKT